jgi:capsular polysaccharide biosynthesis protein
MYFVWITNLLPRLLAVSRSEQEYDKIRFPERTETWQRILFELASADLGIPESAFVGLEQSGGITVPGMLGIDFIPWLRKLLLKDTSPGEPILFISRALAKNRRIDCEPELLRRLNLQPTFLEKLHPQEQAHVFHAAKLVISPNGSALINVIFFPAWGDNPRN